MCPLQGFPERLRQHPAKSKIVILLSDGVSNAGDISPTQAAELAAEFPQLTDDVREKLISSLSAMKAIAPA